MSPDQVEGLRCAFGLRKTAHGYFELARQFPAYADQYRAEARRLINTARWFVRRTRTH